MANQTVNLPSRMLVQRLASCRVVLWALLTHGSTLIHHLKTNIRALPADIPQFTQEMMRQLAEVLAQARDRLIAADRDHRDQKAVTSRYRRRRNAAFEALYPHVVGLRDTFRGAYGPEVAEDLGFAARTPDAPGELFEQAEHLTGRLSDPPPGLDASRYRDVNLDPAGLADEMRPLVGRLGQALEEVSREERKTEATLIAKEEALDAYERTFLWSARTAESLFRLADMPEVARRVRPSTRRRGLTAEVEAEGPDVAFGADAEADAEAATDAEAPAASPADPSSDPLA